MRAKFIGDPREPGAAKNLPDEFVSFGLVFERGKFTEIPPELEAKFAGNSHFETKGAEPTRDPPTRGEVALNPNYGGANQQQNKPTLKP